MGVGSNFFYMATPIDFIEVFKLLLGGLQPAQKGNEYRYYLYSNERLSIKGPDKDNHHCLVLTSCHSDMFDVPLSVTPSHFLYQDV